MLRLYFHVIEDGELTLDTEGLEFSSISQAREEALAAASQVASAMLMQGAPIDGCSLRATDRDGNVAFEIRPADII